MCVMYAVGARARDNSLHISGRIGMGRSTLVVVTSQNDRAHHAMFSPFARVMMLDDYEREEGALLGSGRYTTVVLDDVVQSDCDATFIRIMAAMRTHNHDHDLIVSLTHPTSIPVGAHGVVVLVSDYRDSPSGLRHIDALRTLPSSFVVIAAKDSPFS